jgi:2',3'-cyclic-nucleotide 2'-phosphodiesterase (5'-nucleotidase family)
MTTALVPLRRAAAVEVGVTGVANPDTKNVTLPAATEGLTFLDPAAPPWW